MSSTDPIGAHLVRQQRKQALMVQADDRAIRRVNRASRQRAARRQYLRENAGRWAGGTGILVLLLGGIGYGIWHNRRVNRDREQAKANLGELGIETDWLDGVGDSSLLALYRAASDQVSRAKKGQRLNDYRQAEDLRRFWSTATSNIEAYVKTAYWLAVASRIAGSNDLGKKAGRNLNKSRAYFLAAGYLLSRYPDGEVPAIYADARAAIQQAGDNAQLRAIAKILGEQGKAEAIETAEQAAWESSPGGVYVGTVKRNLQDVATIAQTARGLVTGEKPGGMDPNKWRWMKWGLRLGIGTAALVGLRLLFAAEWKAVRGAASSTWGAARRGYDAARPELGEAGRYMQEAYRHARRRGGRRGPPRDAFDHPVA